MDDYQPFDKTKDKYLMEVVVNKYFHLLDPRTDPVPVTKKTFEMFLKLMSGGLAAFNTNQHGGLKICMYCWSIIMRKKKLTHVGCPILGKHIRPEYTLAEAFGKIDQDADERFRIFKTLLEGFSRERYQPKAYMISVKGELKVNYPWSHVFPKLTIMSEQKHRCYTLFVVPNASKLENMYRQSKPKPGFVPKDRRRPASGFEQAWGPSPDETFGTHRIRAPRYDPDEFVTDTIIHNSPNQLEPANNHFVANDSEDSSSEEEKPAYPNLTPHARPLDYPNTNYYYPGAMSESPDKSRSSRSTMAPGSLTPTSWSMPDYYRSQHPGYEGSNSQISSLLSPRASPSPPAMQPQAPIGHPKSEHSAQTYHPSSMVRTLNPLPQGQPLPSSSSRSAQLTNTPNSTQTSQNQAKLCPSYLLHKTLELLGFSSLKISKNGKVIDVAFNSEDQFYSNPVCVRKEIVAQWVQEVLKESE